MPKYRSTYPTISIVPALLVAKQRLRLSEVSWHFFCFLFILILSLSIQVQGGPGFYEHSDWPRETLFWKRKLFQKGEIVGAGNKWTTRCSLNIVFFLKIYDFSELKFCCCSAGVWPAIEYTHWYRGETERGQSPQYILKSSKKTNNNTLS